MITKIGWWERKKRALAQYQIQSLFTITCDLYVESPHPMGCSSSRKMPTTSAVRLWIIPAETSTLGPIPEL